MALSREEFGELVEKEYSFVCATLVSRFRMTPDQAQDAVQEKLTDLFDPLKGSRYKTYDPARGRFSTWLTALSYRAHVDNVRHDQKWLVNPRKTLREKLEVDRDYVGRRWPEAETDSARRRARKRTIGDFACRYCPQVVKQLLHLCHQ